MQTGAIDFHEFTALRCNAGVDRTKLKAIFDRYAALLNCIFSGIKSLPALFFRRVSKLPTLPN
jgi:hypothetical protein